MAELTLEQKRAIALATARKRMADKQKQPEPRESMSVLPFSKGDEGYEFDSNAGLLGTLKRTFTLPGEVYAGQVDPLSEEGIGRAMEMATVVSPASAAMKAGERAVPGMAKALERKIEPPSKQMLADEARRGYDAMRQTGAEYPADAVKQMAESAMVRLNEQGYNDITAPGTFNTFNRLANPPSGSVADINGLHAARKTFGKLGQNFNNPTDQKAAAESVRGLDDFIGGYREASVVDNAAAGKRETVARLLKEANGNFAASKRSGLLGGIAEKADLRAAAANSGQNLGNAIRSRVASALEKPKQTAGFNEYEKKILETIVRGTKAQNATRFAGNFLGGGGGLGGASVAGMGAAGGAMMAGPVGAAVGGAAPVIAGISAKSLSNSLTERALMNADKAVRMRSPLFEKMAAETPMTAISPEKRALIMRMIAAQQMSAE